MAAQLAQVQLDTTQQETGDRAMHHIQTNFTSLFAGAGGLAMAAGTFVANGASDVTVAAPSITAKSQVLITLKTVGGTVTPFLPYIDTITPGTGFTVKGSASDTSTYNYLILG